MSGKTSPAQLTVPLRSFYGESPPKKSRLLECNNSRSTLKTLKDNLNIKSPLDCKITTRPASSKSQGQTEHVARQPVTPQQQPRIKNDHVSSTEIDSLEFAAEAAPLPLKNLGNTCYENSIIQCLFSLDTFMSSFGESMQKARKLVTFQAANAPLHQSDTVKVNGPEHRQRDREDLVTENDVRYKIADAFQKLYATYVCTQNQTESDHNLPEHQNALLPQDDNQKLLNPQKQVKDDIWTVGQSSAAISLCKSEDKAVELVKENVNVDENHTACDENRKLTSSPIALTSPSCTATTPVTSRNEQSKIENRLEDLKSAVGDRSTQFNSTHQQDASEFFYHVIDSIQEFYQNLNGFTDDDNPVTKAFELELDHLIRCPKCHHSNMPPAEKHRTLPLPLPHVNTETSREECNDETNGAPTPPTSDLGLDSPESTASEEHKNNPEGDFLTLLDLENPTLPKPSQEESEEHPRPYSSQSNSVANNHNQAKQYTLSDALNNYFKDDVLDYTCSQPGCDSKQRTKRCLIRKLPPVLFLSLARYSYTCKKSLEEIEAPFELSVPFLENRSPAHSPSAHRDFDEEDNKYKLVAIVCHLGSSLNAGHYTSYVYNQKSNSWYWCDDESITKVNEQDVAKDASKNGYCFFYCRKTCIQNSSCTAPVQVAEVQCPQRKDYGPLLEGAIIDSSVVMTPESSPTSSPTPTITSTDLIRNPQKLTLCSHNPNDIDDWP